MKKIDLCFVGAGFQASTNIYPAVIESGANIKAIATRSISRSEEALRRFASSGVAYDSVDEMLKKEECHGVIVVAQADDMPDIVRKCIKAGKNVFAEKPLGWTSKEARELAKEAEDAGTILMVAFMKRYAPSYQKLKEFIESAELGKVKSFNMDFAVDSTPFCPDEESYSKLASIHMIDLMRFLFGEVSEVSGFKGVDKANISQAISAKFESGVVGSAYFVGMDAWSRERENILVTFENGFIAIEEINQIRIHKSSNQDGLSWTSQTESDLVLTPSATPMSGAYRDLYMRGFVGEINHFIECCLENKSPSSSGVDNVKTMKLVEAILLKLEN